MPKGGLRVTSVEHMIARKLPASKAWALHILFNDCRIWVQNCRGKVARQRRPWQAHASGFRASDATTTLSRVSCVTSRCASGPPEALPRKIVSQVSYSA
jgi:hypothetical protein